MALVEYVPEDIDDDRVRELLAADAETYGRPSLFARALANNPDVLAARQRYVSELVEGGSLDSAETELAYAAVSAANDCEYCVASHAERLVGHLNLDEEVVDAVPAGEREPFDRRERAILDVARTAAVDPKRLSRDDVDRLRAVGFDDTDVVELVAVLSAAVAANTVANALNVLPQDTLELDDYASSSGRE